MPTKRWTADVLDEAVVGIVEQHHREPVIHRCRAVPLARERDGKQNVRGHQRPLVLCST